MFYAILVSNLSIRGNASSSSNLAANFNSFIPHKNVHGRTLRLISLEFRSLFGFTTRLRGSLIVQLINLCRQDQSEKVPECCLKT